MQQLNATEAKREFGELLMKVQTEPVGITRNGKQVSVVISDENFRISEEIKMQALRRAIAEGMEDIEHGRVHSIKDVFDEVWQKIDAWEGK